MSVVMLETQDPNDIAEELNTAGFDGIRQQIIGECEHDAVPAVLHRIDFESLVDDLEGRNGLRTAKPDTNGLANYIWRHGQLHAGHNDSIPVKASWWLQDYLDENGIDAEVSGIMDDAGDEVTSALATVVDAALIELGESTLNGAKRWAGILG